MSKKMRIFIYIASCLLLFGCGSNINKKNTNNQNTNNIVVQSDVEFVQAKLPDIEEIKSVKYYYQKLSRDGEIGLEHIEFVGFIEIGDNFLEKIEKEYKWRETEKSKKIIPKINLSEEKNEKYNFLYNYEFSHDGEYKSHSSTGDFYLDLDKKLFYFELEYS